MFLLDVHLTTPICRTGSEISVDSCAFDSSVPAQNSSGGGDHLVVLSSPP